MIQRTLAAIHYPAVMVQTSRFGFTLTEVLVAIVLLAIVLTAFHAHTLLTIRQIVSSGQAVTAATLARARVEKIFAAPCVQNSGTDSANGVTATWSVTTNHTFATINIKTQYNTVRVPRTETYLITGACHP